jgi:hypothetical protein
MKARITICEQATVSNSRPTRMVPCDVMSLVTGAAKMEAQAELPAM